MSILKGIWNKMSGKQIATCFIVFMVCITVMIRPETTVFLANFGRQMNKDLIREEIEHYIDLDLGGSPYITEKDWHILVGLVNVSGTVYAYGLNGTSGQLWDFDTDQDKMLNWAIDNLTAGRTSMEKVIFKGEFIINSPIIPTDNMHLILIGSITLADEANCDMLQGTSCVNFIIEGGEWDGNRDNQSTEAYGMIFDDCADGKILNTEIHDIKKTSSDGHGIRIEDSTRMRVEGCTIHDNSYPTSQGGAAITFRYNTNDSIATNNIIYNVDAGIYLYCNTGETVQRNTVSNNVIRNITRDGISLYGLNVATARNMDNVVDGNTLIDVGKDGSHYGVKIGDDPNGYCKGNVISNNNFIITGTYSSHFAAVFNPNTHGCSFIGNYMENFEDYTIVIKGHQNTIMDNIINGSGDDAIYINGGDYNSIIDNHLYDITGRGVQTDNGADNNKISGNYIKTTSSNAIYISNSTDDKNMVTDNYCIDITAVVEISDSGTGTAVYNNYEDEDGWTAGGMSLVNSTAHDDAIVYSSDGGSTFEWGTFDDGDYQVNGVGISTATAAIEAAWNWLNGQGGGQMRTIGGGEVWEISSDIDSQGDNVRWVGDWGLTLRASAGMNDTMILIKDSNITIQGLYLDGNKDVGTWNDDQKNGGIRFIGAQGEGNHLVNIKVIGCKLEHIRKHALYAKWCDQVEFAGNVIINPGWNGIDVHGGCFNVHVHHNYVEDLPAVGITLFSSDSADWNEGVIYDSNIIKYLHGTGGESSANWGLALEDAWARDVIFSNNMILDCEKKAIVTLVSSATRKHVQILNNLISNSSWQVAGHDAMRLSDINGLLVSGNMIVNSGHNNGNMMELDEDITNFVISDNYFFNNQTISTALTGIQVTESSITDGQIDNNFFGFETSGGTQYGIEILGGVRITMTGNRMDSIEDRAYYLDSGADDCIISGGLVYNCGIGIYAADTDYLVIQGVKFVSCTTPIDINRSSLINPMIMGCNWRGCTNNATIAAAVNERVTSNIDTNGAWWSTGDDPA